MSDTRADDARDTVVLVGPSGGSRCAHRVARRRDHPELWRDAPVDEGVRLRAEAAARRRRAVRDALRGELDSASDTASDTASVTGAFVDVVGDDWEELPGPPAPRADERATLVAARDGARVVWGAALPADPSTGRAGIRCVLVADPAGGYVPAIVVNHKVVDPVAEGRRGGVTVTGLASWAPRAEPGLRVRRHPEDVGRLAHAWRLLGAAGLAADRPRGAVLGLGAGLALVHELDDALGVDERTHAMRLAVARGEVETAPSRIGECRSCPWWEGWTGADGVEVTGCRTELVRRDDVSLVVGGARVTALRRAGVTTVRGLAERTGGRPEGWSGEPYTDAVRRARAWRDGIALVPRVSRPEVPRGDVEVDVDLESHLDDGAYLWGTLLTVRDGRPAPNGEPEGYRAFGTWRPLPDPDEGRAFAEFWAWLTALRDAARDEGRSLVAYCYSRSAENAWMLSSATRFGPAGTVRAVAGVPERGEVARFLGSSEWVDVHEAVASQFVSTVGTGLKAVAPVAGFSWRDPGAGGEASLGWYRDVVAGDTVTAEAARRRITDYNEDDVRATRAVRDWVCARGADGASDISD